MIKEGSPNQQKILNGHQKVRGQKVTHRPKVGVLSLVGVVIQTDEVKSRLHLIAAPPEHVISADTLTAHLVTPAGRQEVEEQSQEEGTPPSRGPKGDAVAGEWAMVNSACRETHWLLWAPPRSQSHGRQPFWSLLRPQCWSWKQQSSVTQLARPFQLLKKLSEPKQEVSSCQPPHTHVWTCIVVGSFSDFMYLLTRCQERSVFSHHTLVTVSSRHQAFTEAASCLAVAGISSRKRPQRTAAARWRTAMKKVEQPVRDGPGGRCCERVHTFAAFGGVAEPIMSVPAAVAALPLHVGFAAALAGDEPSAHVRHPVAHPPVQRAHRVAVAGCRRTMGPVRESLWDGLGVDSPSQMLGSRTSLSGCWK